MVIKKTDLNMLNEQYAKAGNQLVVIYGRKGCAKEQLIREFLADKQCFYYRCRKAEKEHQKRIFGEELRKRFDCKLTKDSYDDYFNHLKADGPSKLVVVIDDADLITKKDPEFVSSIFKLKNKKLYAGPVMIVLASNSIVWAEEDVETLFEAKIKKVDEFIKVGQLGFIDIVQAFPEFSLTDSVKMYGVLGGVPEYLEHWDVKKSFKQNICDLVLSESGALYKESDVLVSSELRELSVYFSILSTIANGNNKLNDIFLATGFSRAKISVYMKNLASFDVIEKVVSFQTGGWENAKKGVYRIKDTFTNFWFTFIYENLSDLHMMEPGNFYDKYIEPGLDSYLNRYFKTVCMEYMMLLNQVEKVPFEITKIGTWIGKNGSIDIIAQSTDRKNIIGICNWDEPFLTNKMVDDMIETMKLAKVSSEHFYLFSAKAFEIAVQERAKEDKRFELIDMNEL